MVSKRKSETAGPKKRSDTEAEELAAALEREDMSVLVVAALEREDMSVFVRFLVETREHMKRQTVALERIAHALERPRSKRHRDLSPEELQFSVPRVGK